MVFVLGAGRNGEEHQRGERGKRTPFNEANPPITYADTPGKL